MVESKKEKGYIQAVTIIGKSFIKKIKYIILGGLEIMDFIYLGRFYGGRLKHGME